MALELNKKKEERMRRWEDMNTDCLVNIFRRLGLEELSVSVPFVCRSWHRASLDPTCWRVLKFRGLDFMPWSALSKGFSARYGSSSSRFFSVSGFLKFCVTRSRGGAIEIELPLRFGASLEDLTYISHGCPKLKKVALPNLQSEEEPQLPEIVGRWQELEHLEMESKPSSFKDLVANLSPKLSSLKVSGSFRKDDIQAIINNLPKIESLCLSKSYLQKDELLAILTGCKCLKDLVVRDCVGFEADDEEVVKRVVSVGGIVKVFEDEGSRLIDESGYETDECDPFYVHVM